MFYRKKTYQVKSEFVSTFNKHFNENLLPTQIKHGSSLVGRWMTNDQEGLVEIFAIWEYDSYEDYLQIEEEVRSDRDHVKRVKDWYNRQGGRDYVISKQLVSVKDEEVHCTVEEVEG
ncbi:NIPSNAP family protein [Alkalibacillus haloalkaliphilus]|uniref:NIPSNAP family protein n=1 Tax=Alkalibacillus haloalkaliphilus TaxID=94136 RepID=UPI00293629F3|nr:NIPSNAP family protein [Alkalibacillus haloalkaliphilus]MDV2583053.1 NIPSNAP family protein [Alkalibacillus haloalkaliphilus]